MKAEAPRVLLLTREGVPDDKHIGRIDPCVVQDGAERQRHGVLPRSHALGRSEVLSRGDWPSTTRLIQHHAAPPGQHGQRAVSARSRPHASCAAQRAGLGVPFSASSPG